VAGTATVVTLPATSTTVPIAAQQLTFTGPSAARTITFPDAAITVARTDAANTFTGVQTMTSPAITTPAITGLATGSGVATANTVSTLVARDGSGNFAAGTITAALTGTASGNLVSGGAIGAATATTPSADDNDTSVATTAYVQTEFTAYAADTVSFTNKTLDAEGTGNVVTLPLYKDFPAAGCNNVTASSFWDLPTSSPAVPACRTGTNTQKGTLDFADAVNLTAQTFMRLPTGWTGAIDAMVTWISTTTSGDVVWQLAIACASDGEADDPAFTDDVFTADTTKGTANLLNDTASNTITTTGTCAAGDIAHIRIRRDSAHASDNMAGTARLVNLQLTYRIAH